LLTRLATLAPMMFIVSSVVFTLVHLVPGNPTRIVSGTRRVSQAKLENVRRQYRLDRPN
jgi:ABC-type dipeptide/oligopeptide/nickel transport system permease component